MSADKEKQKSQLKELIAKGKEQGYLTYAEVNDHLPESVTETEQIEDIIQMVNDLGIPVHERAPEQDDLLLEETPDASDDDVAAEEAAAVLASVENEPGRTTDPVRMYMREMGTVELLTREGEIAIAKRIEEGIREILNAMAYWPGAVAGILEEFDRTETGERRLADIIAGYLDPDDDGNAAVPPVIDDEAALEELASKAKVKGAADEAEEETAEGESDEEEEADTGLDPVLAAERFNNLRKLYQKVQAALKKYGPEGKMIAKNMEELAEQFTIFKLTPRLFDGIANQIRGVLDEVRVQERAIMHTCIKRARMDRRHFIDTFPGNEINVEWVDQQIALKKPFSKALEANRDEVLRAQRRLIALQEEVGLDVADEESRRLVSVEAVDGGLPFRSSNRTIDQYRSSGVTCKDRV